MSLLNPALLAGLGLAVIPVLLHLLLRAKPKRLIFPALRLIQQRRRQNVRRMQLRHLWLLLLRTAVIALIVLAVCRPSLPAANYSLRWWEWVVLALIVAAAVGSYYGVMRWWERQSVARATLLTRRTMLRGGIGLVAVLLAFLGVAVPYARRVSADIKNPSPRAAENVPVAAVFLFDTSVSMAYKQANKTRLHTAQELAKSHLSHLPGGSKVAVATSGESSPTPFSTDLVAAQSRVEALEIKAVGLSLNDRLRAMLQVQEEDRRRITSEQSSVPADKQLDRFVRAIYIFTDLTRTAWREETSTQLRDELERLRMIGVYLIDVGEEAPVNVALTHVKLSREATPAGSSIQIDAVISATGSVKPDQTVELSLRPDNGQPMGKMSIKLEGGTEETISFDHIKIPDQAYTQGELKLVGSDPLAADDVAYFSVQTIPALNVLVVAERPTISQLWIQALKILNDEGVSSYNVEGITTDQLVDRDLNGADVVCLINASQPSEAVWTKLRTFVDGGGGLAVFLGTGSSLEAAAGSEKINPLTYNTEAAQAVLPARLVAALSHSPSRTMDLRRSQHLFLKRFEDLETISDLGQIDVRRYWKVSPVADAVVVAQYTSDENGPAGTPALVERRIGQGRVLMMTTGVDGISWNDLPSLQTLGLYLVFADQLTLYLTSQSSGRFNHEVGDEVVLPMDRDRKLAKVIVRMPDFKQRAIEIPEKSRAVSLRNLNSVGSYSVDSADASVDYHMGFSLNLPAAESDFTRIETKNLDELMGAERYSIHRTLETLKVLEISDRMGQEMYSLLVAMLVAVFAMEQFTATWFYRTDDA
ncbi:MAG: BatA domain-containing protein [Planctomycetes bacterium]|nr:BatA domain-containing protein [Planctomycetota bacterium]